MGARLFVPIAASTARVSFAVAGVGNNLTPVIIPKQNMVDVQTPVAHFYRPDLTDVVIQLCKGPPSKCAQPFCGMLLFLSVVDILFKLGWFQHTHAHRYAGVKAIIECVGEHGEAPTAEQVEAVGISDVSLTYL